MSELIGVLALQGGYQKHVDMLSKMGVGSRLVRTTAEMEPCAALIIPGGESTTMSLLIQSFGLYDSLQQFASDKPVMGVCAGAILMCESVDDARVTPLNIMPVTITRNHYGRQVHSFTAALRLAFDSSGEAYPAHFIRAPAMTSNDERIEVLVRYQNEAVAMRFGQHLAVTFHPELTDDSRVHEYWLKGFHSAFKQEAA